MSFLVQIYSKGIPAVSDRFSDSVMKAAMYNTGRVQSNWHSRLFLIQKVNHLSSDSRKGQDAAQQIRGWEAAELLMAAMGSLVVV